MSSKEDLVKALSDLVETVAEDISQSNSFVDLMNNEITNSFHIVKVSETHYDIVNRKNSNIIFEGISILPAAILIAKGLNDGLTANSHSVQQIIKLEEKYHKNRFEAMDFKKKMSNKSDPVIRSIYETKYATSRDNALESLHQINQLYISSL